MAVSEDRSGSGGAAAHDRFIPVRKTDVLDALIDHGGLPAADADKFRRLAHLLGAIYHYEYFDRLETLRNDYYYFNPDLPHDTPVARATLARTHDELVATLVGVLEEADFVELTADEIAHAHRERHVLKVEVELPSDGYREVRFFRRGRHRDTVEIVDRLGLRRRQVTCEVHDHLVLIVPVKPANEIPEPLARRLAGKRLRPGTILIKVFRDITCGDVNMLFPDVRVVLSLFDKMALGLPALLGGIPVLLNLLPTLTVLFLLATAYLGISGTVHDDDMKKALAALSGLLALGGFLMQQWLRYERQSMKYHKEIADNVYFRNVSNNAGALETIVGSAEEQECKEAFLAYYFLAVAGAPLRQDELERRVEAWLKETFGVTTAFAVGAAVTKLERLTLLRRDHDTLSAPPLDAALDALDRVWADFFPGAAAT